MRTIRFLAVLSLATISSDPQVWAFGAGGTAPGGPLSGSMRPACNGYNMDGTVNTSPGAARPGCVDRSTRARHPSAARDRSPEL